MVEENTPGKKDPDSKMERVEKFLNRIVLTWVVPLLVSLAALALAAMHAFGITVAGRTVVIDNQTLGLFAVAAAIWLVPAMKSFKMVGVEIEFRKLARRVKEQGQLLGTLARQELEREVLHTLRSLDGQRTKFLNGQRGNWRFTQDLKVNFILAELFRRKLIARGPTHMAIGENLADKDLVTDAGKALLANAPGAKS
jgi:hypothetical protein